MLCYELMNMNCMTHAGLARSLVSTISLGYNKLLWKLDRTPSGSHLAARQAATAHDPYFLGEPGCRCLLHPYLPIAECLLLQAS
jgi:hypothetical protein